MVLNSLLLFIPVALALKWYGANPLVVFAASALAIVPLTAIIGRATDNLAVRLGETLGGLLNATMGNVPEMVIGLFALHRGLQTVVKASMTGSILGNVLFILGVSLIAGGTRFDVQRYNLHLAGVNAKLLLLAAIGLIVPSLFHFTSGSDRRISLEISAILLTAYVASLAFTLVTHRRLFTRNEPEGPMETGHEPWSVGRALGVLGVTSLALAVMSEALTGAVEPAAKLLGLSPIFAGIFLLATVGNISGLINAVQFARRNRTDLTVSLTLGGGTQAALLVAPVLVFASHWLGHPMDLLFSRFEVVSIAIAVLIGRHITIDGESNWLEGMLLVCVYAILGVGFYHLNAP